MPEQTTATPIRLSQNQIRSNPVLAAIREYSRGRGRRDQERRQLAKLLQLQDEGVILHRIPTMIRVDSSMLKTTRTGIGVVGLVVDNQGQGYVTKLKVVPNPTWDISVDLPFRPVHIQNLVLRVLSGSDFDDSLPELFAYRITDSLADRCEGDSMDIACLLAVLDASTNHENPLLRAAAAVVSPADEIENDRLLEASKSVSSKLHAFVREFGSGSLLVRHATDDEAAEFDTYFDQVWAVKSLPELATRLNDAGLTDALLKKVTLKSEHGFAIASQMQSWLANESTFGKAKEFLGRLKRRENTETPLRIRLEISLAEEDLHRHQGNFDAAIQSRESRLDLLNNPLISCYEREADSDNRHAAALYDAHRFDAAINCLAPWAEKFNADAKVCLPETRAKLFNTLARCMVAVGDVNWEPLFCKSLEIQGVADPGNVCVTESYLVHGYLKFSRHEDARMVLGRNESEIDPYRVWLHAECSRQEGDLWDEAKCKNAVAIPQSFHVHGFACQAIARQSGRAPDSQLKYLANARRSFEHGTGSDVPNVKRVLAACCKLAISVVKGNSPALDKAICDFRELTSNEGFEFIRHWYETEIARVDRDRNMASIESLFKRIPHL